MVALARENGSREAQMNVGSIRSQRDTTTQPLFAKTRRAHGAGANFATQATSGSTMPILTAASGAPAAPAAPSTSSLSFLARLNVMKS